MRRTNRCALSGALFLFTVALLSWGASDRAHSLAGGPRADYFPKVTLFTQDNKKVDFYNDLVKGKIVLINFMYTTCDGICVPGTDNLVKVQKLLAERVGREVFMYSITLDPDRDTPAVLKEYAQSHGVKPGWLFLTGNAQDITNLRRKLGLFDPDPKVDADRTQHMGMVRIGNEATDKWRAINGLAKPEAIVTLVGRMRPLK